MSESTVPTGKNAAGAATSPVASVTDPPSLLVVAHGSRDPRAGETVERLAGAAAETLRVRHRVANVDVTGPTVAEALDELPGPVVAVPAFLSSGYHVRTDLPAQLAAHGRAEVTVSEPLGPAEELVGVMVRGLDRIGWCPGDPVVFAAAGSADPGALADVRGMAAALGARVHPRGEPLRPTYVTSAEPRTSAVCAAGGYGPRTFVAPYLLAPGLFHQWLSELPSAGVAAPLGEDREVARLVVRRYRAALARLPWRGR
ncbi:sirohydrochlorin chelatase [Actinopolyspora mortivallis]|uniref:Cobalamin biosynthesis protein CbiX n=1 Tax=Actinopolyspora mortivallis TaxID=33906 RepID=A0A2T0GXA7_ACTMO|nr:CbiX/SirB N-terminal domain-containing protein [Actinopolyspora mortivallis]PRW63734.1 cobalamin biosynthesis protein CbiX [Actinopolyspora mortivallis]